MFTGLIEEIGTIKNKTPFTGGYKFNIAAKRTLDALKLGDSIAVSGVCLTVVETGSSHFTVDAVLVTCNKTTLGTL